MCRNKAIFILFNLWWGLQGGIPSGSSSKVSSRPWSQVGGHDRPEVGVALSELTFHLV